MLMDFARSARLKTISVFTNRGFSSAAYLPPNLPPLTINNNVSSKSELKV